jgi:hypothetical protein
LTPAFSFPVERSGSPAFFAAGFCLKRISIRYERQLTTLLDIRLPMPLPSIEVARTLLERCSQRGARRNGNSMSDDQEKQRSEAYAELEREMRQGRKFTAQEAIARMVGPGAMKGASPVSKVQQAETEIGTWLGSNLTDSAGALQALLHRQLKASELLLNNLDQPLLALADYCQQVLASDYRLEELVREADVEWGRRMEERPHFNREGFPAHPDDLYTNDSVRTALGEVLTKIPEATSG